MKILFYDLETSPSLGYFWRMWKENIGWNQVVETGRMIAWAAKWADETSVMWGTEHHMSHEEMVEQLHELMGEADVIVSYNGNNFDRPIMNTEFLHYRLPPPAPSKQVDLYQVVKKEFRFLSNRLAAVLEMLGLSPKEDSGGFELWVKCMEGDDAAWDKMISYNTQDVLSLEELYYEILPWIRNHPNASLYDGEGHLCPGCGSAHVQRRGFSRTSTMTYQRYQCNDCGTWSRARLSEKVAMKPTLVRDNTK